MSNKLDPLSVAVVLAGAVEMALLVSPASAAAIEGMEKCFRNGPSGVKPPE
jgi:hypothetical protein